MTFEDFLKIVRTSFEDEWDSLTKNEVNDYFESEMEYIRSQYDRYSKDLGKGKINLLQFENAAYGATGGCLALMY